ncbi:MAG: DUF222 domain-containing protein [Ilumatobacteraceae bacterium]|nr:DUF222 domain-containing protein [Ilumatobacteraceae bacterium]
MTIIVDPAAAVRAVLPADVALLDGAGAAQVFGQIKAVRGFIDSYEARLTAHVQHLSVAGQSAPATDLHTRNGGVSANEARQKERRAEALGHAPSLADQLADGAVTAGHADALANATTRVDDEILAEFFEHEAALATDAARMTPEEFGRNCRDMIRHLERDAGVERAERQRRETRLSKKIDREGMYVLNARLHPELGHAVFNSLDAETAALIKAGGDRSVDRAAVAAEALGNLVTGGHQAERAAEAEIRLHVDERTASTGELHDHSICEFDDGSPIPPASVVRLMCNGTIVPIILDADGVAVDVGQARRLANRAQRRALRAMYRSCAFHGCDVAYHRCEIHHIHEWEHGGPTDLANLLPLCSRHHHVVHEGGWSLHLEPDRTLTIRQSDGELFATVPLERPRGTGPTNRTGPPGHTDEPAHDVNSGAGPPDDPVLTLTLTA